jgi:hypothetical protein
MYCFGHIHEGHGAKMVTWKDDKTLLGQNAIQSQEFREDSNYPEAEHLPIEFGKETLMVNAAIMQGHSRPVNAPWLFDLDLPKAG